MKTSERASLRMAIRIGALGLMSRAFLGGGLLGALVLAACSPSGGAADGTGGAGSGGRPSTSTGGASSSSGGATPGSGGASSSSGGANTGGARAGSGGMNAGSGGAPTGTGGAAIGGAGGRGGAGSGGRASTGGTTGSGGAAGGGTGTGVGGASPSSGCGVTDWLKSGRATIDVSGTAREYILKIPDGYSTNKPYKLIFAWHWKGGSANDVVTGTVGGGPYYGLEQRAAGTAIFVSPEGIDAGFANTGGRDSNFVRAMVALFNSKLCIDQQRIFSTGFSYGGMMSDSIGCEMADIFRAIAPMSGAITNPNHQYSGCKQSNSHPIAVWMSHGDTDTTVPLADGKDALNLFVARNQCQAQTTPVTPSPCVAYQGCAAGYPVHWCQFSGGHGAPSFASAAIWNFFSAL